MDKKTTGIVSYLTWGGWLIAYLAGDKEGAKFHLNQSLVLMIAGIVWSVAAGVVGGVAGVIPVLGSVVGILLGIVGVVVSIALFVFWILGLVAAIKEEEKPLPVLGGIRLLN
ncbi:MAG: hypothetical protein IJ600_07630 [Lachnospiraceae bacterium]|nr:hypothetical protein [Lachnospiraceae bacterium]